MDTVNIPSETVPAEMKACEQTLKRAKELVKAEPVVAYWCSFAAAQRALNVANRSGEGTKWLMRLLDALEQMKAVLATNEAVTNEAAGAAYIENFALKVFMSADNDDRKGNTGKATIRRFVVAGQFIEVLRCFENGMTEEMEQKLQYARWKAADGAKALREGRTPTSGPPLPEQEDDPFPTLPSADPSMPSTATSPPQRGSFSSQTRPTVQAGSPAGSITPVSSPAPPKSKLPTVDIQAASGNTPKRTQSSNSVAWSTVATPGLPDSEDGHTHFDLPSVPSDSSSARAHTPPAAAGEDGERKTVRFTGPDGAPLSPAQTYFSTDSYDTPDAPPPTVFEPSPTKAQADQSFTRPRGNSNSSSRPTPPPTGGAGPAASRPRTDSSATLNGSGTGTGGDGSRPRANSATRPSPIPPNAHVPPPPPPSLASYPSAPPPSNGLGLTSPAPSAPPQAAMAPPAVPTRKQTDQAQKHAKFAVSALDYDDYATARLELRKALALLGG